jgi:hypothetical protein
MKHIIKYRGLLQESESTLNSSVDDLRHLLDLGMITSDEYSKKIIEILRSTGRLSTAVEPGVSIDDEDAGDDLWSDWAQEWSAPSGERIVKAEGSVDSEGAGEITFLLDTGLVITVEMSYGGLWTYGVDVRVRIEDREVASDTDVTDPDATWSGTEEMLGTILSDTAAKYGHLAIDRLIDGMINKKN